MPSPTSSAASVGAGRDAREGLLPRHRGPFSRVGGSRSDAERADRGVPDRPEDSRIHDDEARARLPREHVDRRAARREVGDHLAGDLLG